ncbi:MAG: hypothetical protein HC912_06855 [Saprospiraceae bacterium]|nr:hypothetical protein [Saprospiraceae bacterium]
MSRFYKDGNNKVERGAWIAYQKSPAGLVEVASGAFEASEEWCNTCVGLQSI